MNKMALGDFFYYTLLKHGKIIIAIVGLLIAIIVFNYSHNFSTNFEKTTSNSINYCEEDSECFEHCGECVSIKTSETCAPNESIKCACINNTCTAT